MYRTARKEAGLTLEDAAWRLNVAPRTLGKYESGELRVPEATVIQMEKLYRKPGLSRRHCAEQCPIGLICQPVFQIGNVATNTLNLMCELGDVNERMSSLMSIASDGQVTAEEQVEFEAILRELEDLRVAIERMNLLGVAVAHENQGREAQAA